MLFNYLAKDKKGLTKKGQVEAISAVAASEILRSHGLLVLSLEPEAPGFAFEKYLPFFGRVSRKELVLFMRQLSTLINAKVPIVQALNILREQVSSRKLKEVISQISQDVEGGKSLSESAAGFSNIFSDLFINLVKSGEIAATLDQSLTYLADQQERDYDLNSKIRGAMTYPIFIISAILIVGSLMFVFVLPQMIAILKEAGVELPLTTRILIFATEVLQKYWPVLVFGLIGLIIGFRLYIRSSGGKVVWDIVKLKFPIISKLLQKIYMDRMSRNLATLIAGGIPIVTALRTVAEIVGNSVYRRIILDAADEVETGRTIASVFAQRKEIPVMVTQMIKIGEETATLDEILNKIGKFFEKEVETTINTLTTLLEPIIMILLGLAVAVMVAGILLPIYNLASIQ